MEKEIIDRLLALVSKNRIKNNSNAEAARVVFADSLLERVAAKLPSNYKGFKYGLLGNVVLAACFELATAYDSQFAIESDRFLETVRPEFLQQLAGAYVFLDGKLQEVESDAELNRLVREMILAYQRGTSLSSLELSLSIICKRRIVIKQVGANLLELQVYGGVLPQEVLAEFDKFLKSLKPARVQVSTAFVYEDALAVSGELSLFSNGGGEYSLKGFQLLTSLYHYAEEVVFTDEPEGAFPFSWDGTKGLLTDTSSSEIYVFGKNTLVFLQENGEDPYRIAFANLEIGMPGYAKVAKKLVIPNNGSVSLEPVLAEGAVLYTDIASASSDFEIALKQVAIEACLNTPWAADYASVYRQFTPEVVHSSIYKHNLLIDSLDPSSVTNTTKGFVSNTGLLASRTLLDEVTFAKATQAATSAYQGVEGWYSADFSTSYLTSHANSTPTPDSQKQLYKLPGDLFFKLEVPVTFSYEETPGVLVTVEHAFDLIVSYRSAELPKFTDNSTYLEFKVEGILYKRVHTDIDQSIPVYEPFSVPIAQHISGAGTKTYSGLDGIVFNYAVAGDVDITNDVLDALWEYGMRRRVIYRAWSDTGLPHIDSYKVEGSFRATTSYKVTDPGNTQDVFVVDNGNPVFDTVRSYHTSNGKISEVDYNIKSYNTFYEDFRQNCTLGAAQTFSTEISFVVAETVDGLEVTSMTVDGLTDYTVTPIVTSGGLSKVSLSTFKQFLTEDLLPDIDGKFVSISVLLDGKPALSYLDVVDHSTGTLDLYFKDSGAGTYVCYVSQLVSTKDLKVSVPSYTEAKLLGYTQANNSLLAADDDNVLTANELSTELRKIVNGADVRVLERGTGACDTSNISFDGSYIYLIPYTVICDAYNNPAGKEDIVAYDDLNQPVQVLLLEPFTGVVYTAAPVHHFSFSYLPGSFYYGLRSDLAQYASDVVAVDSDAFVCDHILQSTQVEDCTGGSTLVGGLEAGSFGYVNAHEVPRDVVQVNSLLTSFILADTQNAPVEYKGFSRDYYKYRMMLLEKTAVSNSRSTLTDTISNTQVFGSIEPIYSTEWVDMDAAPTMDDRLLKSSVEAHTKLLSGSVPFFKTFSGEGDVLLGSADNLASTCNQTGGLVTTVYPWECGKDSSRVYSSLSYTNTVSGTGAIPLSPVCTEDTKSNNNFCPVLPLYEEYFPLRELRLNDFLDQPLFFTYRSDALVGSVSEGLGFFFNSEITEEAVGHRLELVIHEGTGQEQRGVFDIIGFEIGRGVSLSGNPHRTLNLTCTPVEVSGYILTERISSVTGMGSNVVNRLEWSPSLAQVQALSNLYSNGFVYGDALGFFSDNHSDPYPRNSGNREIVLPDNSDEISTFVNSSAGVRDLLLSAEPVTEYLTDPDVPVPEGDIAWDWQAAAPLAEDLMRIVFAFPTKVPQDMHTGNNDVIDDNSTLPDTRYDDTWVGKSFDILISNVFSAEKQPGETLGEFLTRYRSDISFRDTINTSYNVAPDCLLRSLDSQYNGSYNPKISWLHYLMQDDVMGELYDKYKVGGESLENFKTRVLTTDSNGSFWFETAAKLLKYRAFDKDLTLVSNPVYHEDLRSDAMSDATHGYSLSFYHYSSQSYYSVIYSGAVMLLRESQGLRNASELTDEVRILDDADLAIEADTYKVYRLIVRELSPNGEVSTEEYTEAVPIIN